MDKNYKRGRRGLWLCLLFLLTMQPVAQAQKVVVKGTVTDRSGPLPGATVFEKGNLGGGVTSDAKGEYVLSVRADATLVVSCLGYKEAAIPIAGRTRIDVKLEESYETLQSAEVVSLGYGSVARRDLTGSVGKVNMDDIVKSTSMNFDQAIAGRVAGVVVTTSDGQVGASANIIIRGNNSLTQSSSPLYVIDGFPTESSFATSISPADIESVDVLKDASASAIYGARGANGVIIITTKKGSQGAPKVNVSTSWTVGTIARKVDLLDGPEFVQMTEDYAATINRKSSYCFGYDEEGELVPGIWSLSDYVGLPSADWQDQVYRTAYSQNHNISVSGGSRQAGNRYNLSFAALNQNGVLVKSNFQRYSGKFNFSQDLGKRVRIDMSGNYAHAITNGAQPSVSFDQTMVSSYLMYQIWGFRPIRPLYIGPIDDNFIHELVDEGVTTPENYRFNPAANVRNQYRKVTSDYLGTNLALDWHILDALTFRATGGYTLFTTVTGEFNNSETMTGHPAFPLGYGPNGQIRWDRLQSWLGEGTLTYDKVFGLDHSFQALAGMTFQGESATRQGVRAHHIQSEELGLEGLNTGDYQAVEPYRGDWKMSSGLLRISYNYRHKYYLTTSFRADGSSKFPADNRWGWFPSASLAWTFSHEPFLERLDWLSTGKLRASWGVTGNNRTTTPYDYYARFTSLPGSNENMDYVRDGITVPGYFPQNMANRKLRWETTEQTDIGLDLGFFDGRISLVADVYVKNTRDLLLNATMPASSGFSSAMINVGSMRNRGIEFSLTAIPVRTRHLSWTSTLNFGMNRNTVTGLSMNQTTLQSPVGWSSLFDAQIPYVTKIGMPTGMMYGFRYLGTYKSDEFNNDVRLKQGIPYVQTLGRNNVRPGDPKYEDVNGDGIISDSDRTIIGIGQPMHTGGWDNTFNFFGFDLSVFFNWSYGNNVLNANRLLFEYYSGNELNQFGSMRNAWTADRHPDSDIPRAGAGGMDYYSSRVVEDGSFLRFRSLTLGYTLPDRLFRKWKPSAVRVYVTGENLLTITNYSGPDPEVSTRNSVLTPGFDWSAYPRARSVTGGLSLTF